MKYRSRLLSPFAYAVLGFGALVGLGGWFACRTMVVAIGMLAGF